jgi:hypothetical protein
LTELKKLVAELSGKLSDIESDNNKSTPDSVTDKLSDASELSADSMTDELSDNSTRSIVLPPNLTTVEE